VFDHARYVDEVVPALVDLVRTATIETPWLAWFAVYRPDGMACWGSTGRTLSGTAPSSARICVAATTGMPGRSAGRSAARSGIGVRCTRSRPENVLWVLQSAFTTAVELRCLGQSQWLGRSRSASRFLEVLDWSGVPEDDRLGSCWTRWSCVRPP
jgi:hypothetical protein